MEEKTLSPVNLDVAEKAIHKAAMNNRRVIEEDLDANILHLVNYQGVGKFKSIRRAIRKGLVSPFGEVYPKRPFKNTKSKKGSINDKQKRIYEQLTGKNRKCN